MSQQPNKIAQVVEELRKIFEANHLDGDTLKDRGFQFEFTNNGAFDIFQDGIERGMEMMKERAVEAAKTAYPDLTEPGTFSHAETRGAIVEAISALPLSDVNETK